MIKEFDEGSFKDAASQKTEITSLILDELNSNERVLMFIKKHFNLCLRTNYFTSTSTQFNIEKLNVDDLVNKYDIKNYVFALMDYQYGKLNTHLKINFNNNKISKNISHKINNINSKPELNNILEDLKFMITDLWKEENLVNLLMPLYINLKFKHKNLNELDDLKSILNKISIIDTYTLEDCIRKIF